MPTRDPRCRALFIGINYVGTNRELRGCWRDVATMFEAVESILPQMESLVLVDDPKKLLSGEAWPPTKDNIVRGMQWLVRGAQRGDVLFFFYSGHGGPVRDINGDEDDGWDEALFPLDGFLTDDEIFGHLVRRLKAGVHMTAVMDCCHSGTAMDLQPFASVFEEARGDVIFFAACGDAEVVADPPQGGPFTKALAKLFEDVPRPISTLSIELTQKLNRFKQRPHVTATKPLDWLFSLSGLLPPPVVATRTPPARRRNNAKKATVTAPKKRKNG